MNWKAPPADPNKRWLNRSLELQIILACNWSCTGCDALSQFHGVSFVKRGTMTVAQVQHFVDEMRQANAYFGRIRIMGGEPSLHPKLTEIVHLLHTALVQDGHVGQLELITNGSHPEKLTAIRSLVKVRVSDENDKQKHHVATLVHTPESLGYQGKRCSSPEHCGWSLSCYGFAPCSAGAGLMRLWDMVSQYGLTSLPQQKGTEANWPELQRLCDLCYHGLRDEHKIKCGTGQQPGQHALNAPGPEIWERLAPWLTGQSANWPIYGAIAQNDPLVPLTLGEQSSAEA